MDFPTLSRASWSNRITTSPITQQRDSTHTVKSAKCSLHRGLGRLPMTPSLGQRDRIESQNEARPRQSVFKLIISGNRREISQRDCTLVPGEFEKKINKVSPEAQKTLNNSSNSKLMSLGLCGFTVLYWDAVMSWTRAPVCKWKRCSSWPSLNQSTSAFWSAKRTRIKDLLGKFPLCGGHLWVDNMTFGGRRIPTTLLSFNFPVKYFNSYSMNWHKISNIQS